MIDDYNFQDSHITATLRETKVGVMPIIYEEDNNNLEQVKSTHQNEVISKRI